MTGTLAAAWVPTGEGKFFFTMMAAFGELERDMVHERTMAGLAASRRQGRIGGRPSVMDDDDEVAARANGVDTARAKRIVYLGSAAGCGAAGAVLTLNALSVQPDAIFNVQWSAYMIFIVVIGGMGSVLGAIVSGLALGLIEGLAKVFYSPISSTVVFILMALVLTLRPAGLFGKEK